MGRKELETIQGPIQNPSWYEDYFKLKAFGIQHIQKEAFLELPLSD